MYVSDWHFSDLGKCSTCPQSVLMDRAAIGWSARGNQIGSRLVRWQCHHTGAPLLGLAKGPSLLPDLLVEAFGSTDVWRADDRDRTLARIRCRIGSDIGSRNTDVNLTASKSRFNRASRGRNLTRGPGR